MLKNKFGGFTLIELLTVLAIAGILAVLVYPSYVGTVRKARRAEAWAALVQLMQQEERYYSQHTTYIAFSFASSNEDAKRFKWFSGSAPEASGHEISAAPCADESIQSCIQLTAKPGTDKVNARFSDEACGNLSLTSSGIKLPARPDCW